MTNSAMTDVKRLLRLAQRMGLPTREAINQVRDLTPDAEQAADRLTRPATERPAPD
jgi:hypothetical protein